MSKKLGEISYITKLAGFEHTKYIQGNCSHTKKDGFIPLFIGKTVRDGHIDKNFDWYIDKKISDSLERSKLTKKCIVMPYVGSVGDLAIFDASYEAHLGSNIAKIEIDDNCGYDINFIYHYLKSPHGQKVLLRDIQGAIQKNITMGAIRDVELPNISLKKQIEISKILDEIDDKIKNNNSIISELESMAKTLYDYWFLQFEFPNKEGKPYKSSGGKMVWNEELKRDIPEGWNYAKLMDIEGNIVTGKTPSTKEEDNYGADIPFITIGDIRGNMFITKTEQSLSLLGADTQSKKYLPENSICVTCIATPGLVGITTRKSQTNQQINSIILEDTNNLNYLYFALLNHFKYSLGVKTGNTFANMNKGDFSNIKLLYHMETARLFFQETETIFKRIKVIYEENQQLTSLRDFLLPMLMNGQVTFKKEGESIA